jgi:hypothetical protein
MNLFHAELLVVLAPALACLVLCGVANAGALRSLFVARVKTPLLAVLANREHVNTLLSLVTNLVFVGGGVGVLYGSDGGAPLDQLLGAVAALLGGFAAVRLSRRAAALARKEAQEEAQALRAVVREALAAHRCGDAAAK